MHPTIAYELTRARIADLQRRAAQDATARAASQGHRAQLPQRRHPAAALARRMAAWRAARGRPIAARPRPRPGPGCTPAEPCHACA